MIFSRSNMIFLLGFILSTAGLALLVVGEFSWLGGKRVPAATARRMGALFVGFFPVVLLVRFAIAQLDPGGAVDVHIVYWSIFVAWISASGYILMRALKGQKTSRRASGGAGSSTRNPFDPLPDERGSDSEDASPSAAVPTAKATSAPPAPPVSPPGPRASPAPRIQKKRPAPPPEENPFDFG